MNPIIKIDLESQININLRHIDSAIATNIWDSFKSTLYSLTKSKLGTCKKQAKNDWMTDEILQLMDERRKWKNKNSEIYKRLQNDIRRKIHSAKNDWLNNQCQEIERLQDLHDDFNLHKKLKETIGIRRNTSRSVLVNSHNEIVLEIDEKKAIWEDYIKTIFTDNSRSNYNTSSQLLSGFPISKNEIESAIKNMKLNKATGPDQIPSEILKLINDDNLQLLVKLFNHVYNTGIYPADWLKSTFIALPKKSNAKYCSEYRLISLMSHALKIFLKVLHNRIYKKCEEAMGKMQFGFRGGMGTREALFCVQVLVENCRDVQKDVFLCFVDYEKAFDTVQHDKLFNILRSLNIDEKEIQAIENLYYHQTAHIVVDGDRTEDIPISKGVRQGCILSPLLFNIYSERIFQEALENIEEGIKVNGVIINNIRYADDTTLLCDSLAGLQKLVDKVAMHSQLYGLKINISKTKYMVVSRRNTYNNTYLTINNAPVERVNKFRYLGCLLNENWDISTEIRCRIEMARSAFLKYGKVLKCRDFNLQLKMRFIKCYVWSVLLYGMEIWTIKLSDMNRLEAFEMWLLRRLLKIPWTDHVSNEEVLRRVHGDRQILKCIKRRKTSYLGHILRNPKYELLQLILQGKIEGRRGIGRKQFSWLRNIRQWTGIQRVGPLLEAARDRELFSNIVQNLF